ncbi:MAG: hypothetical protein HF314_17235 [Ignavibacteria bacterium]|nr:hypothetical protein [Ignavibacteria bacterium]MCU7504830.1 hypothetical protein [Ignavibacteria bacterium]MCU7517716.1 hypothetical protein [Ignavibacteria bacterium]
MKAQTPLERQFQLAQGLIAKENYFDAITELKRLLFFDQKKEYAFRCNYLIGYSYKKGAKLDDAVKYFSLSQLAAPDDSALFLAKTELVRSNILRRTADNALLILKQMEKEPRFTQRLKEINYWKGWAYIFDDDWAKASEEFLKSGSADELSGFCREVEKAKYSVSFAKVISYILPGSGQFYTGNYVSGIMSMAWTGFLGYLTYNSFAEERAFDGLVEAGLFFRFHRGNVQNAEKFAIERNSQISKDALIYLQNNYKGLKP